MRKLLLVAILVFVVACTTTQVEETNVEGVQELVFNEVELNNLGLSNQINESELVMLGLNGTNCRFEEYRTGENSMGQSNLCIYNMTDLKNTWVVVELKRLDTLENVNGSYQYESSHYYAADGTISENTFGDQSKFRKNSENDYGAEFDDPQIHYYHLWITKDLYYIHITSKGSEDAGEVIQNMGEVVMEKFE